MFPVSGYMHAGGGYEIGYECPQRPVYVYPDDDYQSCDLCSQEVRGDAYCNRNNLSNNLIIHEECGKLPKKFTHPFHPKHRLTLQYEENRLLNLFTFKSCDICGSSPKVLYSCSNCYGFYMDVECAGLTPAKGQQNLINHPGSLIACRRPNNYFQYECNVCRKKIEGAVYFEPKTRHLMHESCANLPDVISHPFHPSHTLTLVPQAEADRSSTRHRLEKFVCYACGQKYYKAYCYYCSECGFYLDVNCAFLLPTTEDKDYESSHDDHAHTHQHSLIQCDVSRSVEILCGACERPCQSLVVYVCIECHIVLDESCATLLRQIQHPSHLKHLLILYPISKTSFQCNACGKQGEGFKYVCLDCYFAIDITCAWPIPRTVSSELHQHPLVFYLNNTYNSFSCHHCGRKRTHFFFCCLQCKYYVHLHCLPELPRVLKHDRHLHPLSFTDSLIKDHPDEDKDAELYCNACEERRKMVDPTYYCADCHFVAHIHRLFDQILSHLYISSEKTIQEEGKTKDAENHAEDTCSTLLDAGTRSDDPVAHREVTFTELKSEIAKLREEMKELEIKRQALEKQIEEKEKHAKFIASLCGYEL